MLEVIIYISDYMEAAALHSHYRTENQNYLSTMRHFSHNMDTYIQGLVNPTAFTVNANLGGWEAQSRSL